MTVLVSISIVIIVYLGHEINKLRTKNSILIEKDRVITRYFNEHYAELQAERVCAEVRQMFN